MTRAAALSFSEDGVESQRGLTRAGQPGDDDELVTRDLDGDIFQVVDAGASHADDVLRHRPLEDREMVGDEAAGEL